MPPSMEPPPFGAGNYCWSPLGGRAAPSFNGATAFRRWKPARLPEYAGRGAPLQWSHRLSALETSLAAVMAFSSAVLQWSHRLSALETPDGPHGVAGVLHPSMEPPPFGAGNWDSGFWPCALSILQWSHRLSALETWTRNIKPLKERCLQWSHRLSALETQPAVAFLFVVKRPQWSHRLSALET